MSNLADRADAVSDSWVQRGRVIAQEIDRMRWMLGDWAAECAPLKPGSNGALPANPPIAPKQVRQLAALARAFPPADRDPALSVDVYLQLLRLPSEDRATQLATAREEGWDLKRATAAATQRRRETAAFEDDDPERHATLVYRAWNNAPAEIRAHAWDLLKSAAARGFTLVDEENPVDG